MIWKIAFQGTKDAPAIVGGVNIWDHQWKAQGEMPLEVSPSDAPTRTVSLTKYFIQTKGRIIQFAAGELSPGVWLVQMPHGSRLDLEFVFTALAYIVATTGGFILLHGGVESMFYLVLGSALFLAGFFCRYCAKLLRANGEA